MAGLRWLVLLLLPLIVVKVAYSAAWTYPAGVDGGLYTDIAQNILAGDGVTTNVSLYHRAFASFPHHDSIQPLWPLLYAAGTAVTSIDVAAVWLPSILWLVSLVFAFAWARRILPTPFSPWVPGFGAGHVLVLMLGLHTIYFAQTSRPYTEGLAYALLFAFLWRTPPLFARLDVKSGAELGFWIGLLLLARSQFFIVLAAFGVAGVVALIVDKGARRDLAVFGAVAVAAFFATMAPYFIYLAIHTDGFTPLNYVLFSETPGDSPLSHPEPYVRPKGLAYVAHILDGVRVAWRGKKSYFGSFHLAHWALPVAGIVIVGELATFAVGVRGRAVAGVKDGVASARAWISAPERRAWFFFGAIAIVGFLSVHLLAKSNNRWYFDRRHNLVCLFVFFFALVFLLRSKQLIARLAGAALLIGTVYLGADLAYRTARYALRHPTAPPHKALVDWLNAEHARLGRDFTVVCDQPQTIAWQTPGVSFHWVSGGTTFDDVLYLTDHLGAELLISRTDKKTAPKKYRLPPERFTAEFVEVTSPSPFTIYRRVGKDDGAGGVGAAAAAGKDGDDDDDDDDDAPQ